MVWMTIVVVLLVIVASAVLRNDEPAFPPRRRSKARGQVNVARPAGDAVPDRSVFAGSWHDATDCDTSGDAGGADGCSDSSSD